MSCVFVDLDVCGFYDVCRYVECLVGLIWLSDCTYGLFFICDSLNVCFVLCFGVRCFADLRFVVVLALFYFCGSVISFSLAGCLFGFGVFA